jgi:hypothetical protein
MGLQTAQVCQSTARYITAQANTAIAKLHLHHLSSQLN